MKKRWIATVLTMALCLCWLPCMRIEAEEGYTMTSPAIETLRSWGFTLDDATLNKAAEDIASLLDLLGSGKTDYQTGQWEPISHDVFIFDAEVTFIDLMYTRILTGIDAIVPDIEITDIVEDTSGMTVEMVPDEKNPWMMTDGKRSVSFLCNGHPYSVELTSLGDWVNADFFSFMDTVLEQEKCPFKLYQMTANSQFVAMVYGPYELAEKIYAIFGPF